MLLADILAEVYQKSRDDWTKIEDREKRQNKAFKFSVNVKRKKLGVDTLCDICIWGPHNYIGVFVKWHEHLNPDLSNKWIVLSYHDSCWRSELQTLCNTLEDAPRTYAYLSVFEPCGMIELSEEQMDEFSEVERKRRDSEMWLIPSDVRLNLSAE